MKKVIALFAFFTMLNIGMVQSAFAQDEVESEAVEVAEEQVAAEEETAVVEEVVASAAAEEVVAEPAAEQGLHKILKQKIIEGGAGFMGALLLCFILGTQHLHPA